MSDEGRELTASIEIFRDQADGVNEFAAVLYDTPHGNTSYEGYGRTEAEAVKDALRLAGMEDA